MCVHITPNAVHESDGTPGGDRAAVRDNLEITGEV